MDQGKRTLTAALITATTLGWLVSDASAIIYTESPDAGQTLATATNLTADGSAGTPTGLTTILGSFATGSDADVYEITVSTAMTLSISTVNAVTLGVGSRHRTLPVEFDGRSALRERRLERDDDFVGVDCNPARGDLLCWHQFVG